MKPMSSHFKDQLSLHFIVFIWGFTAILGRYITIDALSLVFNRTALTSIAIAIYMLWKKRPFSASTKELWFMALCGILIAVHWITFFGAIKIANVSITLAGVSTGALFSALLNPVLNKGKLDPTELALGAIVVVGIVIVFYEEPNAASIKTYAWGNFTLTNYQLGLLIALFSASLSASFSILNKQLVARYPLPVQVTFWELTFAFVGVALYDLIAGSHNPMTLWATSANDWWFLAVLALLCTAYPFIKSVELLKRLSPFSVMLAINLEPVYGILLAALLFGAEENMNPQFYFGVLIILGTVIANGIIKAQKRKSGS
jgi:drug/metabolite transporter (DMT)-like permease